MCYNDIRFLEEELEALQDVWLQKTVFNQATKELVRKQEREIRHYSDLISRKEKQIQDFHERNPSYEQNRILIEIMELIMKGNKVRYAIR
jgi:hypothetical protein